ncbi:hypothetical protein D9M69_331340 [compost metagenome]
MRSGAVDQPLRRGHPQWARVGGTLQEDLAALQVDQPLALVEADVHRAVGVQHQAAAVGEGQLLALADAGALVGQPGLPGPVLQRLPADRAGAEQHGEGFQRVAAAVRGRRVEGAVGEVAGQAAQAAVDRLDALPGLLVFRRGGAPGGPVGAALDAGLAVLQFDQPLHGLRGDGGADGGRGHVSRAPRSSTAARRGPGSA